MVKKIKVIRAHQSDHNAACTTLHKNIGRKLKRINKREQIPKSKKNINWQKLWIQENEIRYRESTNAKIEEDNHEMN